VGQDGPEEMLGVDLGLCPDAAVAGVFVAGWELEAMGVAMMESEGAKSVVFPKPPGR
jgi:hypothetical protein